MSFVDERITAPGFGANIRSALNIVDFFCLHARLAIEVDGASHATDNWPVHDARRNAWLKAQGIRVVRVPAIWVINDAWSVAERARMLAEAMIEWNNSRQSA
jgi:very-short-patch-repair endonuclease